MVMRERLPRVVQVRKGGCGKPGCGKGGCGPALFDGSNFRPLDGLTCEFVDRVEVPISGGQRHVMLDAKSRNP